MHETVFYLAAIWMAGLLGAAIVLIIRAADVLTKILALDTVSLLLIAMLILYGDARRSSYYLDAALILALLSFVSTIAAVRYQRDGKVFE
jgi:multisubunit Na+/H+ antiporter MnhF subunit